MREAVNHCFNLLHQIAGYSVNYEAGKENASFQKSKYLHWQRTSSYGEEECGTKKG